MFWCLHLSNFKKAEISYTFLQRYYYLSYFISVQNPESHIGFLYETSNVFNNEDVLVLTFIKFK